MIKEISKCTTTFAKSYTKKWIQSHIRTKDIDGTSKEISAMLTEKFPQFSHTVVVYPPLSGFSKHTTNFGIAMFRWREKMNIVVSILYRKEKRCGSPDKNLGQFLTYSTEAKTASNGGTPKPRKTKNDDNAYNLYTQLERYGNTRLLVFKGRQFSVQGYPNNIWCTIIYDHSIDPYSTTIVYI